ncbi:MAG TPA: adenylate/guanylate cyclase domain-containing protein [Xanthobacteraceae bacterium]|nr:adenylate/guanylate cyclase domain-containing protein [Xanthobacteraceae bacterium]
MRCPSCAAEVPDGSRFCNACGTALPVICGACAHSNAPGSNFCAKCGTRLTGEPPPARAGTEPRPSPTVGSAERRQVTVMFCDLVGSTAWSAQLDPEDLRDVIAVYYREVADVVRQFGGFVAKYMGDGVLVYFSYPEAHEDDAERAVRAGLELIGAVTALPSKVSLQVRVGIATGLVVVGDMIGSGEAQERGIVGETPNLAARLQGIARPNMVVIAEGTRRLLANLFELEELGTMDLKGLAGPVRAWAALRPTSVESRFDALHASSMTALVGREEEAELLLRRWARAKSGEGQAVLLSGEAGIGKSRLTAALLERLADEPHARLRYFCSPQHTDSALYPIIGQMERAAALSRDDSPQAKLDKLDAVLAQTSTSLADAALFAEMLSLANDGRYPALEPNPEQRRQKTLEALARHVHALTRSRPVLVIFEDAHWTDPTSLEAFGRIVDRIRNLRVLLIVTFRPEFEPPWIGRPHVTSLTINRLTQREIDAMIDRVVGNMLLPTNIRHDIIERTDGIPLFVEEMTKAIMEAGSQSAAEYVVAAVASPASAVPASLHASLMARLDRLGPAKEVAQIGAAIGREFSHALLAAVARRPDAELGSALDRLIAAGLLFRQGVPPHASYLFKHALMQDAAYGTLLRGRREALHARIAEVHEQQFRDLVEVRPELVAHHLARAGFAERAIAFWLKAARNSIGNGAVAEAVAQLQRSLALIGEVLDKGARQRHEIELQIALGNVLMAAKGYSGSETDAAFRRARELCLEAGDTTQLVRVLWGQFTGHFAGGRQRASLAVAKELVALSEQLGDTGGLQIGQASAGASLLHLGFLTEARTQFEHALAVEDERQREWAFRFGQSGRVVALSYLGLDLLLLGFADKARQVAEQSVEEAQKLSHPPSLCFAHSIASRVHYLRGDKDALAQHAAMVVKLANEQGLGLWQALGAIYSGWSRGESGAAGEAVELMRTGLAKYRGGGAGLGLPLYFLGLAKVEAGAGNHESALRLIDEAQDTIKASEERWIAPEIDRLAGDIALTAPEHAAKAQAYFERAFAVAREQQAKSWELRAAMSIAWLWRDQGRRQQARELLSSVCDGFTEGFDTDDLKQAKALLDTLA